MSEKIPCPVCGCPETYVEETDFGHLYTCEICGKYEIDKNRETLSDFNLNHLSSYLAYNGFFDGDNKYFSTRSREECVELSERIEKSDKAQPRPVRLDADNVEIWYPKTLSEKIDKSLIYLYSKIKHIGNRIFLKKEQYTSCFFIDRYDYEGSAWHKISERNIINAIDYYMLNCLHHMGYIDDILSWEVGIHFTPEGFARIDELQKNTSSRIVLVAMKFGNETITLRESIRKGVKDAGYQPIFIDEVEHNDFITPELLKYIRDSKFVVVDLTHKNNGAYFEEGYAVGLGKPVIQLCKKGKKLHFDIAQKNTIIWASEDEIPERLKNRIKATIE